MEPGTDICAICLDVKLNPVVLICQHSFCKNCLYEWKLKGKARICTCPLCRRAISRQLFPGNNASAEINSAASTASNEPDGPETRRISGFYLFPGESTLTVEDQYYLRLAAARMCPGLEIWLDEFFLVHYNQTLSRTNPHLPSSSAE